MPANLSFTSRHSMARSSSAKMLSPGHDVHQLPDVLDQAIAEHQGLAVLVLAQAFADTLDRLAQAPVEIALGHR